MNGNQGEERNTSVSRRNLLLNGIVILLCVILFSQVITFIREAAEYQSVYRVGEVALIREVTDGQYDALLESVYRNEATDTPVKGDMAQIYAAAYYYEAAMLYHAHQKAGDAQQAAEKYAQMQAYEEELGEYAFVKEKIWEFLGREPENIK